MVTKKELLSEVNRLNNKYCKGGKNTLVVSQAYGGYRVMLTGKRKKNGDYYKGSLGSGRASVTYGHDTATKTLAYLYKCDSKGWLGSCVKCYNRKR